MVSLKGRETRVVRQRIVINQVVRLIDTVIPRHHTVNQAPDRLPVNHHSHATPVIDVIPGDRIAWY